MEESEQTTTPLLQLAERGVAALERLAEDPVIQIEAGAPACPCCGKFNPDIAVSEDESTGPMFEFVIVARCLSCQNTFYAVPETWKLFSNREGVELEMSNRKGGNNGN